MALLSAFRRILNGSSTQSLNVRSQFSSIRLCSTLPTLTSPKLFISGLSRMTTDENLFRAFAPFGNLREAKVIIDRASGKSRGFGFVSYETVEEAEKAREGMNAKFLDGWVIFVDPAKPREPFQQPPRREMQQSTETGFTTNRTVGWSGLAKSIAWNGEGATCLVEVQVSGAGTEAEAAKVARSVASSSLAKAAVYGRDPNWGRMACAAGYAGIPFNPNELRISLGDILLMHKGQPLSFDRTAASNYLRETGEKHGTVIIGISIGDGPGTGLAWGCDLSYDHVKINAEYTT